jgi:hypothetical protein
LNAADYDKHAQELETYARKVTLDKRPAYTQGNVDVLWNFKNVGQRLGLKPGDVLLVYLEKHLDAIRSALTKPELPQAEEIKGRFADAINYLKLGYALIQETAPKASSASWANDTLLSQLRAHAQEENARRERERQQRWDEQRWFSGWPSPKAATSLLPVLSDGRPATPPQATLCDQAQIAALGAHMQRARGNGVKLDPDASGLPGLSERYRQGGGATLGFQDFEAHEASGDCSTPYSGAVSGNIVRLAELPPDTSPL